MKIIKYHRQRIFFTFFIITTLFISLSISVMAQDLNVSQTLDYLNKKFQDFPFQTDNSIFHYSFSITSNGELRIENADYFKNPFEPGETSLAAKTIFKIGINKIDIKESLESYHYGETDYILYLYPSLNEHFYEERIDRNGVQEYKKTVPYQSKSESIGGVFRNYISIYLGDVGNKQNIRNALMHLYTIVISDPINSTLTD